MKAGYCINSGCSAARLRLFMYLSMRVGRGFAVHFQPQRQNSETEQQHQRRAHPATTSVLMFQQIVGSRKILRHTENCQNIYIVNGKGNEGYQIV